MRFGGKSKHVVRRLGTTFSVAFAVASALTCEGGTASENPGICNILVNGVTPQTATVELRATTELTASFTPGCANPQTIETATWTSSNSAIASLGRTSGTTTTVTGVALGTATITAAGQFPATVTVVLPVPTTIDIVAAPPSIGIGQTAAATATLRNAAGVIADPGYVVVWHSSDPSIATVQGTDRNATITGVSPGTVTITATVGGVTGSAIVVVSTRPVVRVTIAGPQFVILGQTITLTATVFDAGGSAIPGKTASWTSSVTTIADVTPGPSATATVNGRVSGQTTITASVDGVTATQVVNVGPGPVAKIMLTPATSSIAVGGTVRILATATDAFGNAIPNLLVSWQTSNVAIARVAENGAPATPDATVTGVAPGTVTINASTVVGGTGPTITGTATVTVSGTAPPPTARFAYAVADQPTTDLYDANPALMYNSSGGKISINRVTTGVYGVTFQGLARPPGQSEVVLLTAYDNTPGNCKLGAAWSSSANGSLFAPIACYSQTGTPVDHGFSIMVIGSDALQGRFALALADQKSATGSYAPSVNFNSSGTPVTVTHSATGDYVVDFPGNARPAGGSPETIMVTSVGPGSERCAVTGFLTGTSVTVHCIEPTSLAAGDARFAIALIEKGRVGASAAFAAPDGLAGGTPTPGQTYTSNGGSVTQTRTATGQYDITFGGLAGTAPAGHEGVQITQRTSAGSYCAIASWRYVNADLVVSVRCQHEDGSGAEDHDFRILILR
jgi:uncharacterized protein YjdB